MGIPTATDRIIQQAIAQQLVPIYEPLFSDDSYAYRPNRSAQQAIQKVKWYADDIVVLAKSPRAAQQLLESTQRYLEGKLKLKMNVEKSKVVSVYSIRNFKFLGFALGKGKNGVYIRAHAKSLKKAKAKLKELASRSSGRNVRKVMENVKVYIRGWLGYFGVASMKTTMQVGCADDTDAISGSNGRNPERWQRALCNWGYRNGRRRR